jgi:hypothetical protein
LGELLGKTWIRNDIDIASAWSAVNLNVVLHPQNWMMKTFRGTDGSTTNHTWAEFAKTI